MLSSSRSREELSSPTRLAPSLSCHAWNGDGTKVAVCPNSSEVWIFDCPSASLLDTRTWTRSHVLTEHAGLVSAIDWSPSTNRLVTCSHDRNAYVWTLDAPSNEWKPTLVILRIHRAATSVKWSPSGDKFAVGSGAKCVPVCYFEASNNWWISKTIKKHKSTVTAIAWSPNSTFIVTGSTDLKVRIFSAFLDGIDDSATVGAYNMFGAKAAPSLTDFGACLAEFDCDRQVHAWIRSVAWSPSGQTIAATSHASVTVFISLALNEEPKEWALWHRVLPFVDLIFVTETLLIAAGFDGALHILQRYNDHWSLKQRMTGASDVSAGSGIKAIASAGVSSARALFAAAADRGHSAVFNTGANLSNTTAAASTDKAGSASNAHVNAIANIQWLQDRKLISSAGLDGRLCFWDLSASVP